MPPCFTSWGNDVTFVIWNCFSPSLIFALLLKITQIIYRKWDLPIVFINLTILCPIGSICSIWQNQSCMVMHRTGVLKAHWTPLDPCGRASHLYSQGPCSISTSFSKFLIFWLIWQIKQVVINGKTYFHWNCTCIKSITWWTESTVLPIASKKFVFCGPFLTSSSRSLVSMSFTFSPTYLSSDS